MNLEIGAYDNVITASIAAAIEESLDVASFQDLDPAEAPDQFARLVAEATKSAIELIKREDRVVGGAALTNEILTLIGEAVAKAKNDGALVVEDPKPQLLTAVARPTPCLLYTSPSPRDQRGSRMPSSA